MKLSFYLYREKKANDDTWQMWGNDRRFTWHSTPSEEVFCFVLHSNVMNQHVVLLGEGLGVIREVNLTCKFIKSNNSVHPNRTS